MTNLIGSFKNRNLLYLGLGSALSPILLFAWIFLSLDNAAFSFVWRGLTQVPHLIAGLIIFLLAHITLAFFLFRGKKFCAECVAQMEFKLNNLSFLSNHDALTSLYNRRYLKTKIETELQRAARSSVPFSLTIFDIDNLKGLNDTQGHLAGDRALKLAAECIVQECRETDVPCRYGGDEFAILLPDTPKSGAYKLMERIRKNIASKFLKEKVTISGGIATYPNDAKNFDELISFSDRALYFAKAQGKNRICLYPFERRDVPRNDRFLQVEILNFTDKKPDIVYCENYCEGGIIFSAPTPYEVGDNLMGRIILDKNSSVQFLGRITRRLEKSKNRYQIALKFEDLVGDGRDRLRNDVML